MDSATPGPQLRVFIPRERIAERVSELAAQISRDFAGQDLLLLGVLQGATVFLRELQSRLTVPAEVQYIAVSSYGAGSTSNRSPQLIRDHAGSIAGRNVLVVEDILDSGYTLTFLRNLLSQRQPRSLKTVALLDKPSRRQLAFSADYIGFAIEDLFVVGYGMDHNEQFRELPDICLFDPQPPA